MVLKAMWLLNTARRVVLDNQSAPDDQVPDLKEATMTIMSLPVDPNETTKMDPHS